MKKVTVYLNDETVDLLDRVAEFPPFNTYQKWQSYGIMIDQLLRELQTVSICPLISGFNVVLR